MYTFSVLHGKTVHHSIDTSQTLQPFAGSQVRSTADSETWRTYMAAIDEMEQRISALDFPADIDSSLIETCGLNN
jgi:hypothetical protein